MNMLEKITAKTGNIKVYLCIVKILDNVFTEKWYSIEDKDTWNLIYLVNFLFGLHDIFTGSYIANRLVRNAKNILMMVLEQRRDSMNIE